MRFSMMVLAVAPLAALAACGGDGAAKGEQMAAGIAPSSAQVQTALASGSVNTGGRVDATISGGKTATARMVDASFCVKHVVAGNMTMDVFAFAANNAEWAVSLTSSKGMPAVGDYRIGPPGSGAGSIGATIVDKTTGAQPAEWRHYKATSGQVTITAADAQHVAGSYDLTGTPSDPGTGDPVSMKGTFDAPPSRGCDLSKAGVR